MNKISGPLLDRIDLHVEVTPVSYDELSSQKRPEIGSKEIASRVVVAREIQRERYKNSNNIHCNAHMPSQLVHKLCPLDDTSRSLLKRAMEKLQLSARAYDRIIKVARTAADLDNSEHIKTQHLAEAIQYRSLDREGWAG